MIMNIIKEFHWSPDIISGLFIDAIDYRGILYLNQEIEEMHKDSA